MDKGTIQFYNNNAEQIAQKHNQYTNARLIELARVFFKSNTPTLDLGALNYRVALRESPICNPKSACNLFSIILF